LKKGIETFIADTSKIKQLDDFEIGDYSQILDYNLISPKTEIGRFCLIDRFCIVAGSKFNFTMDDFSGIGGGVNIWLQSNDYVNNLISASAQIKGDVRLGKYSGVGSNSTIMPNNYIPEGTVIGANSFVPSNFPLKEWSVYAGVPIKYIKARNKKNVMAEVENLLIPKGLGN